MQHVRDELLAGADSPVMSTALSLGAPPHHARARPASGGVLRDDLRRTAGALELRLQQHVLAREATLLPGAPHEDVDLRHAIRLRPCSQ
jgi:hypothetical protein